MKTQIRLALMLLASASAPAFAQECATTNSISGQNSFTVVNPVQGAINQQCFLTVSPKGSNAAFEAGNYEIELSGGGGGGGGASLFNSGGGGAGAVPAKVTRYLSAGVYRLTLGLGGQAGSASLFQGDATRGGDGNPTSIANAHTLETIAGFPGAEVWAGRPGMGYTVASGRGTTAGGSSGTADVGGKGEGGQGIAGQSNGGAGGQDDNKGHPIKQAQDGGMLKVAGYNAPGGKAGANTGGGGGGAGYGKGADGESTQAAGSRGGDGFIALRALDPIAQAPTSAPAPVTPAYVAPMEKPVAPAVRPRKDRN